MAPPDRNDSTKLGVPAGEGGARAPFDVVPPGCPWSCRERRPGEDATGGATNGGVQTADTDRVVMRPLAAGV